MSDETETAPHRSCHLLNLPAELRLRIFEEVLSPGVLCLTRTDKKRFAVTPTVSPQILATCRQIYIQASKLLYHDNEVTFIMDVHDTFAPVINESRLPPRALEKLQHVCLICDGTSKFQASYSDVDFTPLSALVSLKTLRVSILLGPRMETSDVLLLFQPKAIAQQILERIPASTRILCEFVAGSPQEALARYVLAKGIERGEHGRARRYGPSNGLAGSSYAVPAAIVPSQSVREAVEWIGAEEDIVRGSNSGANPDVFAEHHAELKGFAWRS